MNFQQQQALANAQAMQRGAGAGGITPQQQQQMAMANQMAGQYGGDHLPYHVVAITFLSAQIILMNKTGCAVCRYYPSAAAADGYGPADGCPVWRR